jgi:VWFA-related protein
VTPRRRTVGILVALFAAAPAGAADGAYDLLERVREAYAVLDAYRDEGELVVGVDGAGGRPPSVALFSFWIAGSRHGDFEMSLTADGAETSERIAIRRRGGIASRLDPGQAVPQPLDSLAAELERAFGPGSDDALIVPALVALGPGALIEPEAAAIDGEQRCGDGLCDVVIASRAGGARELRLWIERESRLVRRVEVDVAPSEGEPARTFRVEHRPQPVAPSIPPEQMAAARDDLVFEDRVEVSLRTLELRVVDRAGSPVLGLGRDDFRLRIHDREIPIESVDWTDPARPLGDRASVEELVAAGIEPPAPGRLLVLFVQTESRPALAGGHVGGHLGLQPHVRRLIEELGVDDWVAVVSFDSRLQLRQDFTQDRSRLREALDAAVGPGRSPFPRARREPSLAAGIDPRDAERAATVERALELVGRALEPIVRPKTVVFLGWGMGVDVAAGRDYGRAVAALERADASVFVLDYTRTAYHSLETGMRRVAADTGGAYFKTDEFPAAATARILAALEGFYVIAFRRPEDAESGSLVRVELRAGRRGEVLAPAYLID